MRVTVRAIVTLCSKIGMQQETTLDTVFMLFGGRGDYRGLLEITRHSKIAIADHVSLTDEVVLTARAISMIEYVGLKFFWLIGLMRKCRYKVAGKSFEYDDHAPVTRATVQACLRFLAHLGEMHLHGLVHIRKEMERAPDWLKQYRTMFCLNLPSGSMFKDGRGNLVMDNMLGSVSKYLTHYHSASQPPFDDVVTDGILKQFSALGEIFKRRVEDLSADPSKEPVSDWYDLRSRIDWSVFESAGEG